MKIIWIVVVALALALEGCASTERTTHGAQALQQGNYSAAEASMRAALQSGELPGVNWFNLGLLYYRQAKQIPTMREALFQRSQSALTMSARYGFPKAQEALLAWGRPVPPADLMVRDNDDQSAALALLLVGASNAIAARNPAPPPIQVLPVQSSINCTSMVFGKIVNTDCR